MAASPATAVVVPEEREKLSVLERLSRSLTFYSRVIPILLRYRLAEVELERRCASAEECSLEYSELDEWGSSRLRDAILELQGFYVKSGQVVSTRVDLFSKPYTDKLGVLQDGLQALPTDLMKQVVCNELCLESIDELFSEFSEEPLGSASIAQVHGATLRDGTKVAVKIQRPGARPLLLADVANLKRFSSLLADALPVDYYTVFSELGDALEGELDFLKEAQAMNKLRAALRFTTEGKATAPPLLVPRAVPGLASRRVLVMDFVEGTPLSRLGERAAPNSPEAKFAGGKIVTALGEAYARMIFNGGFVHGDPHPGNIFVNTDTLDVALIDCGQTKQLSLKERRKVKEVVLALQNYRVDPNKSTTANLAAQIRAFGVTLRPRDDEATRTKSEIEQDDNFCLVSVALLLFGDKTVDELPGGYDRDELSANSPLRRLASFPQSLVLVGRAAVLIRGIAATLNVPYSLNDAWVSAAAQADLESTETLPPWAIAASAIGGADGDSDHDQAPTARQIRGLVKGWIAAKTKSTVRYLLPSKAKSWLIARSVRRAESRQQRQREATSAAASTSS